MSFDGRVLTPKNNQNWSAFCFGDVDVGAVGDVGGSVDVGCISKGRKHVKLSGTEPILMLKGLGTATLGRIGEKNNLLRDDIACWKQRIDDSLYIGWVDFVERPCPKEDYEVPLDDLIYISKGSKTKSPILAVEKVVERPLFEVASTINKENDVSEDLIDVVMSLERRDFSGALKIIDECLEDQQMDEQSIEESMVTAFMLHNKGVLEMMNGIFRNAVTCFKESADIKETLLGKQHKSVLETKEQLSLALYGCEDYPKCSIAVRSILHRSNQISALVPRLWNLMALLHFKRGDAELAMISINRAVDQESRLKVPSANRGYMILALAGDDEEDDAVKSFEVAEEALVKLLGSDNEIVQSIRYNMNTL